MLTGRYRRDHGASAIITASALMMLLGFAAIAVDMSAGFNERRQDQTAADTGVMAGAVGLTLLETPEEAVEAVLSIARGNLDSAYSDADWQTLWESCSDPNKTAVDLGGHVVNFRSLPKPSTWGGGTLDCVSSASSYLRVRLPNQEVATAFARIWGVDSLETNAAAIAQIEPAEGLGPLLPFGIPADTDNGEYCMSSTSTGTALDPCSGSSAGAFGEIRSELFGDFFGAPHCSNPGFPELHQNVALGLDHFVAAWGGAPGVSFGDIWPGDGAILSYEDTTRDACRLSSGAVEPEGGDEFFPVNTMLVNTGNTDLEPGLISDSTFLGANSRLRQVAGATSTRDLVMFRNPPGTNSTVYTNVDNTPPWEFLIGSGVCSASHYEGLSDTQEKVDAFDSCLRNHTSGVIFSEGIASSSRFVWAPQYWFRPTTSGSSWQPVHSYRRVYLAGLGFNCNASTGCELVFYPDGSMDGIEICAENPNGSCSSLSLDQMSGWLLPDSALPPSLGGTGTGTPSPYTVSLLR